MPGRSSHAGSTPDPERRLVIGLQPVREVLKVHGPRVSEIWIQRDSPKPENVAELARAKGVGVVRRATRGELDRLAGGAQHQGVLAYAPPLELQPLERVLAIPELLAVALDHVQDPQNFGAVLRSAVGLAQAAVIWAEHSAAPLSAATFRASAGAVEHATLCRVPSLSDALDRAAALGIQAIGLDAHADRTLPQIDFTLPTILVLGAEDRGLSRPVKQRCTGLAKLVMTRTIASLNVSVAAALALYEARSQRHKETNKLIISDS